VTASTGEVLAGLAFPLRPLLLGAKLAVGVIRDGDALKGIVIESKSGRQVILAKRIIDATPQDPKGRHAVSHGDVFLRRCR
jgi:hypothetical protein